MSGTNDYFLTREATQIFLDTLIANGTKIYLNDQYKSQYEDIKFWKFDQIEKYGQLYCINSLFSEQIPVLKGINNIHSGLIYMLDDDLHDGFYVISVRRRADLIYVVSMGCHSFFSKFGGGEFFPPKPELKQCYRDACKLMKKLAIKAKARLG